MEVLLFFSVIGLGFWIYRLQDRIEKLESPQAKSFTASEIEKEDPYQEPPGSQTVADDGIDRSKWPSHLNSAAHKIISPKIKLAPSEPFDLENFLGQKLFPILGAASIVVAIGFFTVWAFANGWIGPMGRIAVGIMFSIILLALGEVTRTKYPQFFSSLSAAGLAGLIITTLIARHHYNFIEALPSLGLLAAQAATGVTLALRYNSRILGNFAILAGLLAPWFSGQIEPFILLPYVLIMTVGGFTLATQKKWPEIFISLTLLASSFIFTAVGQLHNLVEKIAHEGLDLSNFVAADAGINPIILLVYAFTIYGLIGLAGIIRLLCENKTNEPPQEEIYEIALFTLTLFLANLCAVGVFSAMGWQHIGFLVGAQALIFYGLADYFKTKGWSHFGLVTLVASLLFIFIATIWELRNIEPLILSLVIAAEGVFMCGVGQLSSQKVYQWFGRVALIVSLIVYKDSPTGDFVLNTLGTMTLVTAFIYSIGKPKTIVNKIWMGFALLITSLLVFEWGFDGHSLPKLLEPVAPTIWCLGLIFFGYYYKSKFLQIASAIAFFMLMMLVADQKSGLTDLQFLASWIWVALSGLTLYLTQRESEQVGITNAVLKYGSLILVTLSWLIHSSKSLEEPLITIAWIAWACALFGTGILKKELRELRYIALGVMMIIVTKLYLIDIWQWDIPIRVMAFTALGVALLSIGFFYQKTWLKK